MKPNAEDHLQLERLLAEGYLVVDRAVRVAELKPWSIRACPRGFDWKKYRGDPACQDKFLVMLRHPISEEWVEILAPDEASAALANRQFDYQQEQIGVRIEVNCAARGGRKYDQWQLHLDELARSLNGFQGWEFAASEDVGTIRIKMYIKDGEGTTRKEAFDRLERLFDVLAVTHGIGFHTVHISSTAIRRHPTLLEVGVPWPEEWMVTPATPEQTILTEDDAWPSDVWQLARALREVYWESLPAGRLAKLWAAVEDVLAGDPEHLLKPDELKKINTHAGTIQSLKDDSKRLNKLRSILNNPKTLPKKGIEDRLAERIAAILRISVDDARRRVTKAKKLRGEQVHTLVEGSQAIRESEEFLLNALRGHIVQRTQM